MAKIPRNPVDLEQQLHQQISFLKRSAESFDNGFEDEAVRLAVSIRILVHETPNSHSLLVQLGEMPTGFHDTSIGLIEGNLIPHSGITSLSYDKDGIAKYSAYLDESPEPTKLQSFDAWWSGPIFSKEGGKSLSRKAVILTAANQDGGAHVDPKLDETYRELKLGEYLGWKSGTENQMNGELIAGAERATIRQIAHEILRTLDPTYRKINSNAEFMFMGASVTVVPNSTSTKTNSVRTVNHKKKRLFRP